MNDNSDDDIVIWDPPLPPLRGPVLRDGELVLDFPCESDRKKFREACQGQVMINCQEGARASCAVQSTRSCRGPQWLRWLGLQPKKSYQEVEGCEERVMSQCMAGAEVACQAHSEKFCELISRPPSG